MMVVVALSRSKTVLTGMPVSRDMSVSRLRPSRRRCAKIGASWVGVMDAPPSGNEIFQTRSMEKAKGLMCRI